MQHSIDRIAVIFLFFFSFEPNANVTLSSTFNYITFRASQPASWNVHRLELHTFHFGVRLLFDYILCVSNSVPLYISEVVLARPLIYLVHSDFSFTLCVRAMIVPCPPNWAWFFFLSFFILSLYILRLLVCYYARTITSNWFLPRAKRDHCHSFL